MLHWSFIGKCSIHEALALQDYLFLNNQSHVLFAEHNHVYTCPKAKISRYLWRSVPTPRQMADIVPVERGGSITYHGPGQIVCYMILHRPSFGIQRVAAINATIDTALRKTLQEIGISAIRRERPVAASGLWVTGKDGTTRKIASRGIRLTGDFMRFGFALNLAPDMSYFDRIYPCGIDIQMTSVLRESGALIHPFQMAPRLAEHLGEVLGAPTRVFPHVLLKK